MSCSCISYNQPQPQQTVPEVVLTTPFWASTDRRTVCVDACIVPVIKALWDAKIWTLGCCCGHGDPEQRSVIVDRADRKAAEAVIAGMGDGARVLAWELV